MRARVSAVKRPPPLPLVPVPQSLRVRGAKAGIRVSDAIAWAREILARYGDENLANKEGGHQAAF